MNKSSESSISETRNSKKKRSARESLFNRLERILLIALSVSGGIVFLLVLPYNLAVLLIDGNRNASETEMFWWYLPISIAYFCMVGLIILDCIKTLFQKRKV